MGAVYGVLLHATRSGHPHNPTEGSGTLAYVLTPGTTSYNDLVLEDGTLVHLTDQAAWHAEELNYAWWSIAVAQGTVDDPLTDAQHRTLRWRVQERCEHFEIPRRWLDWLGGPKAARGVTEHQLTAQGQRWGKSDIGYRLNRAYVLGLSEAL